MSDDDLINYNYKGSIKYPHMKLSDRAKQFMPFAALSGYSDLIDEAKRIVNKKIELSDNMKEELDYKLSVLNDIKESRPKVSVTYFIKDLNKEGGKYETKILEFIKVDEYLKEVVFTNKERIKLEDILKIDAEIFEKF